MLGDKPVLMDVNTRPAGGLHQLSQCGINAPWAAVRLALGEEPGDVVPPFLGSDYAVVSGPRAVRPVSAPETAPEAQPVQLTRKPSRLQEAHTAQATRSAQPGHKAHTAQAAQSSDRPLTV